MDKKTTYVQHFGKLYFLHSKDYKNISISKFSKIISNSLYEDYFEKINSICKFISIPKIADNPKRRKQAFETFKYAVSNHSVVLWFMLKPHFKAQLHMKKYI